MPPSTARIAPRERDLVVVDPDWQMKATHPLDGPALLHGGTPERLIIGGMAG